MQEGLTPTDFVMSRDRDGVGVTVRVSGEIDISSSPELKVEICRHLRSGRPTTVDLGAVTFLDASGVSSLVAAHRFSTQHGTTLRIVNCDHRPVARVLAITGADRILAVDRDGGRPASEQAG